MGRETLLSYPAITSLTHKQLGEGVWDGERGAEWGAKLSSLIPTITSLTHKQLGEGVWDGERGVEWGAKLSSLIPAITSLTQTTG